MGKESGFVPIDEVHSERINFSVDLPPFLDRTKIKANPESIGRLMNIGGINKLTVATYEGDRVDDSPTIVGFDSGGGAYSGKTASSEKNDRNKVELNSGFNTSPSASLNVQFDINEMSEKVSRLNARSESVWAKEIDNNIKKGLRDASSDVLFVGQIKRDFPLLLMHSFFQVQENLQNFELDRTIHFYLFTSICFNSFRKLGGKIGIHRYTDYRASLFLGPQLDRVAVMQVLSRVQQLVKGENVKE